MVFECKIFLIRLSLLISAQALFDCDYVNEIEDFKFFVP